MTTQPTLFGSYEPQTHMMSCPHCRGTGQITASEPTSRSSDPETSQKAGARHSNGIRFSSLSRQGQVLALLSRLPLTAQECARRVHGDSAPISEIEGTRRRISTLSRMGLVAPSGEERNNLGSDTPATVWTITEAGQLVLHSLETTGWSH
jgi:hypothetical protein